MALNGIIILGLISLLYIIMIFLCNNHILFSFFSFFCNFYIARRLRVCYSLYSNSKVNLTVQRNLPNRTEFILYAILPFLICLGYFFSLISKHTFNDIVSVNLQLYVITISIWIGIFSLKKLTDPEKSYLSSTNNLTLGYGCAMWYYKNYLGRLLPGNFLTGVRQYERKERVRLPPKLYILCPKSCKVKQYIDVSDHIEMARDLAPFTLDHGGIKGRKYRVSVYGIEHNGEFFRCPLEYAQPLKTLLASKERGIISIAEMDAERELFIKHLKQMLRDRENSHEVCELVEYDDETSELHVILSGLPSLQDYKCRIEN